MRSHAVECAAAEVAILDPDKFDQGVFWKEMYKDLSEKMIEEFSHSVSSLKAQQSEETPNMFYHPTNEVMNLAKKMGAETYNAVCKAVRAALKPGMSDSALERKEESAVRVSKSKNTLLAAPSRILENYWEQKAQLAKELDRTLEQLSSLCASPTRRGSR